MDWVREGKINVLIEIGLRRHPDLQAMGVPWLMDMAETEEDRQILRLILSRGSVVRPFIAPAGYSARARGCVAKCLH